MPVTCSCPTCNKPLRVPDELIGRMVRCPGCQGTFPATAAAPTPAPPPTPPHQIQPKPSPASELPNLSFDDAPPSPESFRRPMGDRAAALALVNGPALSLMIVSGVLGGLAILLFLVSAGLQVFAMSATNSGSSGPSPPPDVFAGNAVGLGMAVVGVLIDIAWAVAVFLGAQRMRQLRTYPFAMTAAILAVLPLSGCVCGLCTFVPWLVNIGFGIWALVILCKPEVKAAFQ